MLLQHFDWDLTHQILESSALKMHILWCRTGICNCKLSAKVSLMLDNPFPVPSFCKLKHISVSFIQISTRSTCKQLIPFRESHVFFEVILDVLGRQVNFNIKQRFILRRPVFPDYLPVSCDYDQKKINQRFIVFGKVYLGSSLIFQIENITKFLKFNCSYVLAFNVDITRTLENYVFVIYVSLYSNQ